MTSRDAHADVMVRIVGEGGRAEFESMPSCRISEGFHPLPTPLCSMKATSDVTTITYDVISKRDVGDVRFEVDDVSGLISVSGHVTRHHQLLVTGVANTRSNDNSIIRTSFLTIPIFVTSQHDDDVIGEPEVSLASPEVVLVSPRKWKSGNDVYQIVLFTGEVDDVIMTMDEDDLLMMKDEASVVMRRDYDVGVDDVIKQIVIRVANVKNSEDQVLRITLIFTQTNQVDELASVDILETVEIGSQVADISLPQSATYFIVNATDQNGNHVIDNPFRMAAHDSGVIVTSSELDCDAPSSIRSYHVTVAAILVTSRVHLMRMRFDVEEANDNSPLMTSMLATYDVIESARLGHVVTRANAYDADAGDDVTYELRGDEMMTSSFVIDPRSGVIQVAGKLDRETRDEFYVTVTASDGEMNSTASFTIVIDDVNDNPPRFTSHDYFFAIEEGASGGKFVGIVQAQDDDVIQNFTFHIVAGNQFGIFEIDDVSGLMTINDDHVGKLDRESRDLYFLVVEARDYDGLSSNCSVLVNVLDVNDNSPRFDEATTRHNFILPSHASSGHVIGELSASDDDIGGNGEVEYRISGGDGAKNFIIDTSLNPPLIKLHQLRHLVTSSYKLVVTANDLAERVNDRRFTTIEITIDVVDDDVITTMPRLMAPDQWFVSESSSLGDVIMQVGVSDDMDDVIYHVTGCKGKVEIEQESGIVTVSTKSFDRETSSSCDVTISAHDSQGVAIHRNVTLLVDDVNDNSPRFTVTSSRHLTASFDDVITTKAVGRVKAVDDDVGRNSFVSYRVVSTEDEIVEIDSLTGEIFLRGKPQSCELKFCVEAYDGGDVSMTSLINMTLELTGCVDGKAEVDSYYVTVDENLTNINLLQLPNDVIHNSSPSITSASNGIETSTFVIDSRGVLTLVEPLNRETTPHVKLEIEFSDYESTLSKIFVYVTINDVNEFAPVHRFDFYDVIVEESRKVGSEVLRIEAEDDDAGKCGIITFSLRPISLPDADFPFIVDPSSGQLIISRHLDRETRAKYECDVIASDGKHESPSRVNIVIDDVDDNPAKFVTKTFNFIISRHQKPGSLCGAVEAVDPDIVGSKPLYSIIDDVSKNFVISPTSGAITSIRKLTETDYHLQVEVNSGDDTAYVIIQLADRHPPAYLTHDDVIVYRVEEEQDPPPGGAVVTTIVTSEPRDEIEYRVVAGKSCGNFTIEEEEIRLMSKLDRELVGDVIHLLVGVAYVTKPRVTAFILVIIHIVDVNDVAPIPSRGIFHGRVMENEANKMVAVVTARDPDQGRGGEIEYLIENDVTLGSEKFRIGRRSGVIRNRFALDREEKQNYVIEILLRDRGNPVLTSRCRVIVSVDDVNDNPPYFPRIITSSIPIDARINDYVTTVASSDLDLKSNNQFRLSDDDAGRFSIDSETGEIRLIKPLEKESEGDHIKVGVESFDSWWRAKTSVHVIVVADTRSKFPLFPNHNIIKVVNGTKGVVGSVRAETESSRKIHYHLLTTSDHFTIDRSTAQIIALRPLTCSSSKVVRHRLLVAAVDWLTRAETTCDVIVEVHPINLNPPQFDEDFRRNEEGDDVIIAVDAANWTRIARVRARDIESSRLSYSIINQPIALVTIDDVTGEMTSSRDARWDMVPHGERLQVVIQVEDDGVPPLKSQTTLLLELAPPNKHGPRFTRSVYTVSPAVPEDSRIGSRVFKVTAHDEDDGINGRVNYRIESGGKVPFRINKRSGEIYVSSILDYEKRTSYILQVQAYDSSVDHVTTNASVIIQIDDVNDNPPIFNSTHYNIRITENHPSTYIDRITASDEDSYENSVVYYSLVPTTTFSIHNLKGEIYLNEDVILDYEKEKTHTFQICACNDRNQRCESSALVIVHVTSQNEFMPRFTSDVSAVMTSSPTNRHLISTNTSLGRTIEKLKTIDGDEGCDGLLQFTIVDTRSNYDVSKLLMVRDDVTRLEADVDVVEGARLSAGEVYDVIVMMKNPGPVWSRDMIDWREIYIEVVGEACLMSPCLNRATCIQPDEQDEFRCLCTSGFTGARCEKEIDECWSDPCLNGGMCEDSLNGFNCICQNGFIGPLCKDRVDHCSTNPCLNGGTCINEREGWRCICGFGNTGLNCEILSFAFDWDSYVKLNKIDSRSTSIIFEFATVSDSSLLLFNRPSFSQLQNTSSARSHFLALEVIAGGRLRLSYGSDGESATRVWLGFGLSDGRWHRVELILRHHLVRIAFDNCTSQHFTSYQHDVTDCVWEKRADHRKLMTSLASNEGGTLVGGVTCVDDVIQLPGVLASHRLVGCVRSFVINSDVIMLASSRDSLMTSHHVTVGCDRSSSSSLCDVSTCGGKGVCSEAWQGGAECRCAVEWNGVGCGERRGGTPFHDDVTLKFIFAPRFARQRLIETDSLTSRANRVTSSKMKVKFRARTGHGRVIMIVGKNGVDLLWVEMRKGRFVVGSNMTKLMTSQQIINDGLAHVIEMAIEEEKKLVVHLDGNKIFHFPFYLDSFTDVTQIQEFVVGGKGWGGCVDYVTVDDETLPLSSRDRLPLTGSFIFDERKSNGSHATNKSCGGSCYDDVTTCRNGFVCRHLWDSTSSSKDHECLCEVNKCPLDGSRCLQSSDPTKSDYVCICKNGDVMKPCDEDANLFARTGSYSSISWLIIIFVVLMLLVIAALLTLYCHKQRTKPNDTSKASSNNHGGGQMIGLSSTSAEGATKEPMIPLKEISTGDVAPRAAVATTTSTTPSPPPPFNDDVTNDDVIPTLPRPDLISSTSVDRTTTSANVQPTRAEKQDGETPLPDPKQDGKSPLQSFQQRRSSHGNRSYVNIVTSTNQQNRDTARWLASVTSCADVEAVTSCADAEVVTSCADIDIVTSCGDADVVTSQHILKRSSSAGVAVSKTSSASTATMPKQKTAKIAGLTRDETKILGQTPVVVDFDSSYGSETACPLRTDEEVDEMVGHSARRRLNSNEIESLCQPESRDAVMSIRYDLQPCHLFQPPPDTTSSSGSMRSDPTDEDQSDPINNNGYELSSKLACFNQYGEYFQDVAPLFKQLGTIPSELQHMKNNELSGLSLRFRPKSTPLTSSARHRNHPHNNHVTSPNGHVLNSPVGPGVTSSNFRSLTSSSNKQRGGRQSAPLMTSSQRHHKRQAQTSSSGKLEHYV